MDLMTTPIDKTLCLRLIGLCDTILRSLLRIPEEKRKEWQHLINASRSRAEGLADLFDDNPEREVTRHDRMIFFLALTQACEFSRLVNGGKKG